VPVVERLNAEDARECHSWDNFVMACPQATFFHRAGWQRIMRKVFRHDTYYLMARTNGGENGVANGGTQGGANGDANGGAHGRITGVLPLAHVNSRLFGNALTSLPFAAYGGVAAEDAASAAALEQAAQALAQQLGVQHLELRNLTRQHPDWPAQDLYVTFRKAILPDEEANMLAIPRKQRAMVRKGIKNGLKSEIDSSVDRFFSLYASNVHRHGTPALSKRYFQALQKEFGSDCEVLTVTGPQGQLLSSVLSFYFRDEVLPYYAGDDEAARDLAANDFKYWELMRRSCARGLKVFDYGRSKQGTGPYAFKKNWGFEPQTLHYEYQLYKRDTVPQNNPANPKYQLMIKTWRRLPVGVANWLGPHVVRNLG